MDRSLDSTVLEKRQRVLRFRRGEKRAWHEKEGGVFLLSMSFARELRGMGQRPVRKRDEKLRRLLRRFGERLGAEIAALSRAFRPLLQGVVDRRMMGKNRILSFFLI